MKDNALQLAEAGCKTLMKKFAPEKLPPEGHFHYHQGVFLSGMEGTYYLTGKTEYSEYIKSYVDNFIDENGNLLNYNSGNLDDLQPGILLFRLLDEIGDKRYETAIKTIAEHLRNWPKNRVGGFWHMSHLENQMWLDGLYMGSQFLAMYGNKYNDMECFREIHRQATLMWKYCKKENGLLYHAWDESRKEPWADKETGKSSEIWGRAAGWYIVALVTILEYVPDSFELKGELIDIIKDYCATLAKYQDKETGLWYQVIDKGDCEGNWTETSCSALFTCGIAKAIRAGYIGKEFIGVVKNGFRGVCERAGIMPDNTILISKICIGTGVGDYEFYINRPTCENDLHGMGAFILMCNECYKLSNNKD